ncbi:uncharacterized protein I206_101993 [Kwoniella pini CBS 10737]|uniref:Zn(2)-C6 fungal-type domain-containing protein n=1 Tax=Kwoniella pini CBS 10737 TaxID=1296096 RepID=A0A1B9HV39_9TREE|nr:uncharacterized protein I206_06915 [Kwoniella pini CBS 10737]OCF47137.1 hypothetical protein I206_06915 [Kwoniella pini CBS 10737]
MQQRPLVQSDWQVQQDDTSQFTNWYPSEYSSDEWTHFQPQQLDASRYDQPSGSSNPVYQQDFGSTIHEPRRMSGVPSLGEKESVSPEAGGSDTSSMNRFALLNAPTSSSSSSGDLNGMMSEGSQQAGQGHSYQEQGSSYSGPSGIASIDHIAPSGTSLRRGMACKFCRRRKLRCSGERPACSSCVKYKQECEYQPPAKAQKVQALESRVAELSDIINQGSVPNIPPAFSSQPLTYDENALQQPVYGGSYHNDSQDQTPYLNYTLPLTGDSSNSSTFTPNVNMNGQAFNAYADAATSQTAINMAFPQPGPHNQYAYPLIPENVQFATNTSQANTLQEIAVPPSYPIYNSHPSSSPLPKATFNSGNQDGSIPINYSYPQTHSMPSLPSQNLPLSTSHAQYPARPAALLTHQLSITSESSTSNGQTANTPSGSASTSGSIHAPPGPQTIYAEAASLASLRYTAELADSGDPVDKITERLGEFLFSPTDTSGQLGKDDFDDAVDTTKKRRTGKVQSGQWAKSSSTRPDGPNRTSLFRSRIETDGLRDEDRDKLLEVFFGHSRLFFEMSIPRFRYRMSFNDRTRPSLALLNAMYLWATRMTASPNLSAMEAHFFAEACRHLDSAGPNSDRLIDAVKAAMLLCAYSYTNGRHHEGWLIAGLAVRLVSSTGLHQIPSLTFRPAHADNPFLRNRVHLLPPPEDAVELAERVHAFWCVYAIEKCGAFATGFPSSLRDEDIATPFGRPLDQIASQSVTLQDDVTIRDLYRGTAFPHPDGDSPYIRWIKAVTILERASKLAFLTPTDDSEYTQAWTAYASALGTSSSTGSPPPKLPPGWLNQPKYRNSKDYDDCSRALTHYIDSLGVEGISPVERRKMAEQEGSVEPVIKSHTILLHHETIAAEMLMHDINSLDTENEVAVSAGRRSAELIRALPPIPPQEVDAQVILVWCMIIKLLIKELRRCTKLGDQSASKSIEDDVDILIKEMSRIGVIMHIARTQSKAMDDFKKAALAA